MVETNQIKEINQVQYKIHSHQIDKQTCN
jgi:hypothetical protein